LMISDNVEFLPPIFYAVFWQPFWKWQTSWKFWKRRIAPVMVTYHCQDNDVPNWFPDIEKFLPVTIFKMAGTVPHKFYIVRFQRHFLCR
jgi:hypothetical protein